MLIENQHRTADSILHLFCTTFVYALGSQASCPGASLAQGWITQFSSSFSGFGAGDASLYCRLLSIGVSSSLFNVFTSSRTSRPSSSALTSFFLVSRIILLSALSSSS
jgi:hypothetical protein